MNYLTAEQIKDNWDKMISIVEETFDGERKEKLLKMYEHFENRMSDAPASGNVGFHSAYTGGYVVHILNVIKFTKQIYNLWKEAGAIINYTEEELIFAALHHDLGKVGNMDNDYYIPNPSEWHRINRGDIYAYNYEKINYMSVTDRTFYILNQFGIKYTESEFLGIHLADGLFDEANKSYFITFAVGKKLKVNIPFILHQADAMAARIEFETDNRERMISEAPKAASKPKRKKTAVSRTTEKNIDTKRTQDLFNDLFGDKK